VGGGAEWFFMPHWSLKAEYLYVDLGTRTFTSTNSNPVAFPLATITHSHSLIENIGRIGLNFHF
jgi:outer membrane immunogenic protein